MIRYQGSAYQEQQLRQDHRSGLIAVFCGATLACVPFGACVSTWGPLPWWLGPLLCWPIALVFAAFRVHSHGLPPWPARRAVGLTFGELALMVAATLAVTIACIWSRSGTCGQLILTLAALSQVFMGMRCHNAGLLIAAEARDTLLRLGLRPPSWPPSHHDREHE